MMFIFQILSLCYYKDDVAEKVQAVIENFAERGLRALAVAYQVPHHSIYLVAITFLFEEEDLVAIIAI